MESRLNKLKNISVKKVEYAAAIEKTFFNDQYKYPLVMKSTISNLELNNWLTENRDEFEKDLLKYGAILCRGFKINTVDKFQHLMSLFPNDPLEYKLRSSPRYSIKENVYVSTTYPEDETINMHSENSYAPNHPSRITFCCIIPSEFRGETPISDNRAILSYLSDSLKEKFLKKEILYKRNLNGMLGLKWQEVFQTNEKACVEDECERNKMVYEWGINDDTLLLKWKKKAIWEHPITKDMVWFNHGLFFNKYMLDEIILNSVVSYDDLPNDTFFGDETEISKEEIMEIRQAYKKATVEFQWEKGDVLFLDNMLFSHGRNPYKGERKIIVSIS